MKLVSVNLGVVLGIAPFVPTIASELSTSVAQTGTGEGTIVRDAGENWPEGAAISSGSPMLSVWLFRGRTEQLDYSAGACNG